MNPEIDFREKYKPDYTGMRLTELPFGEMEDYGNVRRTYWLDLITPPEEPAGSRPVILFIHGGGFTQPCDRKQAYISTFARAFTAEGFAVVSPDYPLFDDDGQLNAFGGETAGYAKAGEAIHLAYRYIAEHAGEWKLDPGRIAIAGGSAGGWAAFYGIGDHADRYRAFLNLWGAPERIPDLSGFPPTLSVHGTADTLVPYRREMSLQRELADHGIEHKLITLEGSGHTPLNRMGDFLPEAIEFLKRALHA